MGCAMSLTAGILSAQQFIIQFTSKTPFAVAGATLAAGTYRIRLSDDDENTFECAAISGKPAVMFRQQPM